MVSVDGVGSIRKEQLEGWSNSPSRQTVSGAKSSAPWLRWLMLSRMHPAAAAQEALGGG